jgi:hypothetical protein
MSNKKLSGPNKIPNTWKGLSNLLEKNDQLYIEPSCNELVRMKFGRNNIPDIFRSRMIEPNSQMSKPTSSNSSNNKAPSISSRASSQSPPPSRSVNQKNGSNNNKNNNDSNSSKSSKQQQQRDTQSSQSSNMFGNAFSPNSAAAQFQGLSELLASGSAGQLDPLAGFMAALAASGANPAAIAGMIPPGQFNPFMLPPPFGGSTGPVTNPALFADMLSKMPPGALDMASFDELTNSLVALQQQQQLDSASKSISKQSSHKDTNNKSNTPNTGSRNLDSARNKSEMSQKSSSNNSNNNNSVNGNGNRSSNNSKASENTNKSSSKQQNFSSNFSKNSSGNNNNKSSSSSRNNSNSVEKASNMNNLNIEDLAAVMQQMQQMDPSNPNMAALAASMMEQEKFMQDMMSLAALQQQQSNSGNNNSGNPFGFNPLFAGGFTLPNLPPPPSMHVSSKRARSPSPARSVSPASSVASNISSAQQKQSQPGLDFSLFMSNLMGQNPGAFAPQLGHMPQGMMPSGMPSASDLSKLPVELLAALSANPGALSDPAMFSALAHLNSLSADMSANEELSGRSTKGFASGSSSSSNKNKTSFSASASSNKLGNTKSTTGGTSKKPRNNSEDDVYQGLDLSMKNASSSNKKPSHSNEDQSRLRRK